MSAKLPSSEYHQRGLLGMLVNDPIPALVRKCEQLGVDDECFQAYELMLWQQIRRHSSEVRPYDFGTLSNDIRLTFNGDGDSLVARLAECVEMKLVSAQIPDYCDQLLKTKRRRALFLLGGRLIDAAQFPTDEYLGVIKEIRDVSDSSSVSSFAGLLAPRKFDAFNPPERPLPIYLLGRQCVATPGNVQVIAAQIKAGKSALVGAFIASAVGDGDTLGVASGNPHEHALIHLDTEQSPTDHHNLIATALSRVGKTEAPDWLNSYRIADIPTAQRFDLLEHLLRTCKAKHGGIHSVLNDGIADFIRDPNDAAEAFAAVERLHRLSMQFEMVIINVLHFNPGPDNKTRGHLGSQLERKAETNLALSKDEHGVTTVYTTSSRHAFIPKHDGPRFKWDSLQEMHISCASERDEKTTASAVRLECVAEEVFEAALRYSEAITVIMKVAKVKERQAETLFSQMSKATNIRKNLVGLWELNK